VRQITRRAVLGTTVAALAVPHVARSNPSSIVVASSGGAIEEGFTVAYYKPFTAKTGIEIISAVNSYSKLKAMVEANAVEWDVMQIDSAPAATNARLGLLEQLDHGVIDKSDLIPGVPREHYLPCDVAAAVMAWNTKNLKPEQVPHSWSDMWDLKRFSGQRGFWKQPFQVMEFALVADGVPKDSYTRSTLIVPSRALTASSPKSSGGPAAPSRPRS
jgi:putative spermidine/putrescine transport system substrate-binding protein